MTKAVKKDGGASPPAGAAAKGQRGKKPRASKATRWRVGVLIGVHVLAAIHIAHWMTTGRTVSPFEPSEAMKFAESSVVNTGLVFFAITILSTLILGRWFCGWACHVVALQDLSRALLIKLGIRPRPLRSKWMALMPIAAAFYMFAWPLVYRLYIGDSIEIKATHYVSEGDEFWDTFTRSWLVAAITFFVAGFAAVYFLGAKGFCTYACPYGAVFGVVDKLSPGRIRVTDACVGCGHCTLTCTSNVDVSREVHDYGMVIDKGCMKCMDCVSVCPEHALYFGMGKPALFAKPRQEKRPPAKKLPLVEEVAGFMAFAFGYFAYRGYRQEKDFLLSMGLAACFGILVVLVVRVIRRSDVRLPGLKLKAAGKIAPLGILLSLGTVSVAAASIPYGIMPAFGMWKASSAWLDLKGVIQEFSETGERPALSDAQLAEAQVMLDHSLSVQDRSSVFNLQNFERIAWGAALLDRLDALGAAAMGAAEGSKASAAQKVGVANTLRMFGQQGGAAVVLRTILDQDPEFLPAYSPLVVDLLAMNQIQEAEKVMKEGLALDPDDASLLIARSMFSADRRDFSGAARDLARVVEADPLNGIARDRLWRVLKTARRLDEAESVLRDGIGLKDAPEEWQAHLAQVLLEARKPEEAVEVARALSHSGQDDLQMLVVARTVFQAAGAGEEAERVAKRIAALEEESR